MVHYILQTIAFQVFFLLVYDVLLKKETFFNWNRVYLLATALLSLILPFVKIEGFKDAIPQNFIISLPEVILGQSQSINNLPIEANIVISESKTLFTWEHVFYAGVFIAFTIFLFKLFKILILMYKSPKIKMGKLKLVQLIKSSTAFSFFNYIFLGEGLNDKEKETILKHELVHVNQKHTLDLLFFEVLRIVFWFNPLVYIYQNKMMVLHEFIADAEAVKHQNKSTYYQNLLAQVFETKSMSFINPFFKRSLIKKRIIMLQKSKSNQINLLKYTLLVPIILGMMAYTSSFAQEKLLAVQNSETQELTDDQLKNKLEEEYNNLKASGADFLTIYKTFFTKSKNYILSREEYYRQNIYFRETLGEDRKYLLESTIIGRSYIEYLEWKKTDEAKEVWENNTHDGVLRLVVVDMKNLTEEEEKRRKEKIQQINKDEYFQGLLMTDGTITTKLTFDKPIKNNKEELIYDIENIDVPFLVIDQVPIFPGCEDLSKEEQRDCLSRNVNMYVNRNFNTKLANELKLTGRQRINVIFKINTEGDVVDVRSRAQHPELEAEAIRVIKTLPKFKPGEHQGKKVNVPYSLPIIFEVAETKAND